MSKVIKITKSQLATMIRESIQKEQVDMRTKDGRELKEMAYQLLENQKQLDAFSESIKGLLMRQKELSGVLGASTKALMRRMAELDTKTIEVTEAIFTIEETPKFKRVAPSYETHYNNALAAVSRFSSEQAMILEAAKEAEIAAKTAMTEPSLTITPRATNEAKTVSKLEEQFLDKAKSWATGLWDSLVGSITKAIRAADNALDALDRL